MASMPPQVCLRRSLSRWVCSGCQLQEVHEPGSQSRKLQLSQNCMSPALQVSPAASQASRLPQRSQTTVSKDLLSSCCQLVRMRSSALFRPAHLCPVLWPLPLSGLLQTKPLRSVVQYLCPPAATPVGAAPAAFASAPVPVPVALAPAAIPVAMALGAALMVPAFQQ